MRPSTGSNPPPDAPRLWITSARLGNVLYIDRMRTPFRGTLRGTLLGTLAIASLCLLGCASAPDPEWTPPPPETPAAPVFASNDEALAAATAAFAAYENESAVILSAGGTDPERIAPFVTADYLPDILTTYQGFMDRGQRSEGAESFDTVSLVRYADAPVGNAEVSIYLCADLTNTRVLDLDGMDVTPPDRPLRLPLQVELSSSESDATVLLVSKEAVWSGRNFC